MSSQPRFALPDRHSPEFAPALACCALVLLIALQLALPSRTALPADPGLSPRRTRSPVVALIPAYPRVLAEDVFSPDRGLDAGGTIATAASIDECMAVGFVSVGATSIALVKAPGGPAQQVSVGQTACGWRLSHIERNKLDFVRDGLRRSLDVGAPPPSRPPTVAAPVDETAQ